MAVPTNEQKEAIKYFNPNSGRGRARDMIQRIPKWRGSHQHCAPGHRDGTCIAVNAWKVTHKTWAISADFVGVNIEENAMGTVKVEGKAGAYPEPVWKAKGWRDVEEADGVRPTDEVKHAIIDQLVSMERINLEHKKAEFETIEKRVRELRLAAERANGLAPAAKGKSSDG